ncbi:hypothetical protein pb186bvf_012778 [Paramecium bursaria]
MNYKYYPPSPKYKIRFNCSNNLDFMKQSKKLYQIKFAAISPEKIQTYTPIIDNYKFFKARSTSQQEKLEINSIGLSRSRLLDFSNKQSSSPQIFQKLPPDQIIQQKTIESKPSSTSIRIKRSDTQYSFPKQPIIIKLNKKIKTKKESTSEIDAWKVDGADEYF